MRKYIPNILSTIRLAMSFALPVVFFSTNLETTLIFYLIGDATDAIDGFLARKWNVQSRYGRTVDPIADKMINGVMLGLVATFVNPLLFILMAFEAAIATTNIFHLKNKRIVKVNKIGKVKTVFLFFTTVISTLNAMVPNLSSLLNIMIGITATLQTITAMKYINIYKDIKEAKKGEFEAFKEYINTNEISDDIKKLKHVKEMLNNLNGKTKTSDVYSIDIDIDKQYECEYVNQNEELGICRTLKR